MTCSQCSSTGMFQPTSSTLKDGEWVSSNLGDPYTCPCCDGTGERKYRWAFSNGTEYMGWCDQNCCRCIKQYDDDKQEWNCDLERALNEASLDKGLVIVAIYERLGLHIGRDCLERVEG